MREEGASNVPGQNVANTYVPNTSHARAKPRAAARRTSRSRSRTADFKLSIDFLSLSQIGQDRLKANIFAYAIFPPSSIFPPKSKISGKK